jgi:uncharacterized protein YcgL (UPF0745 family)
MVQIFRSTKRDEAYLYVDKLQGLEVVPDALMHAFGKPEHVMDMLLRPGLSLARVHVDQVLEAVQAKGFYLQMPPPRENLLEEWKTRNGKPD